MLTIVIAYTLSLYLYEVPLSKKKDKQSRRRRSGKERTDNYRKTISPDCVVVTYIQYSTVRTCTPTYPQRQHAVMLAKRTFKKWNATLNLEYCRRRGVVVAVYYQKWVMN